MHHHVEFPVFSFRRPLRLCIHRRHRWSTISCRATGPSLAPRVTIVARFAPPSYSRCSLCALRVMLRVALSRRTCCLALFLASDASPRSSSRWLTNLSSSRQLSPITPLRRLSPISSTWTIHTNLRSLRCRTYLYRPRFLRCEAGRAGPVSLCICCSQMVCLIL